MGVGDQLRLSFYSYHHTPVNPQLASLLSKVSLRGGDGGRGRGSIKTQFLQLAPYSSKPSTSKSSLKGWS